MRSGVQRGLLLGGRERPRGLPAALLAEHEAHLAGRAQPSGWSGRKVAHGSSQRQRAQGVAAEEAVLAGHLACLRAHVAVPDTPLLSLRAPSQPRGAKRPRRSRASARSRKSRLIGCDPANEAPSGPVFPSGAGSPSPLFRAGSLSDPARCRPSSPASRATSAPPSRPRLRRDGHAVRGFARDARARAGRTGRRGRARATRSRGAGLDEALDGVEVAYYLIHSMEGAADGAFADARAARGRALRARRRGAPGVRRVVYLGGLRAARRPALAPPRLAPGRRGGAAGRGAGVDRAARLDRDRRALALLPLPRAADRAAAGAGAARLARATARRRSTAATCSSSWRAPRPRPAALGAGRGTSPARTC